MGYIVQILPTNRVNWLFMTAIVVVFAGGCARKPVSKIGSTSKPEDNWESVRPRYTYKEVAKGSAVSEPVKSDNKIAVKSTNPLSINKKLQSVLDTISRQNQQIRYLSGFRIQLYTGNIRNDAENARKYIYQMFPNMYPYLTYTQPTYKVRAGDFMYQEDAEKFLSQIRSQYVSAMILPDKIEIKKGLVLREAAVN